MTLKKYREQRAEASKRYRENHREQINEYQRKYRASHPDKVKNWEKNRLKRMLEEAEEATEESEG